MQICDPCSDLVLFLFIFDQGRCVPKYSSDSIASQKVKEKQAGPHMFDLRF
jgi:hypothetical protein